MERTFGIEIEMVGVSRRVIANAVHGVVGGEVEQCIDEEGITFEKIHVAESGFWKVEDDDSLGVPENVRGELVSPILRLSDLDHLRDIAQALGRTGAGVNDRCGLHVHIGAVEASIEDVSRLVDVMISEEEKLIREFNCNKTRIRRFARPMTRAFVRRFQARRPRALEGLQQLWYGRPITGRERGDRYHVSRYRGLNLQSYFFRGTIEFRYFDSSLDPDRVVACVRKCLELADCARLP